MRSREATTTRHGAEQRGSDDKTGREQRGNDQKRRGGKKQQRRIARRREGEKRQRPMAKSGEASRPIARSGEAATNKTHTEREGSAISLSSEVGWWLLFEERDRLGFLLPE
ncbi:hypothetical protein AAHE18_05G248400 [Arachis hypogaea]